MNEIVREFLLETNENLAQLDLDLVTLEKSPTERETLARVFRTLHTVKGTAGFLGLPKLQAVAHAAENLLSRLRAGELIFQGDIAPALLAVVDVIRRMLAAIEATETEGDGDFTELIQTLEQLTKGSGVAAATPSAVRPPSPDDSRSFRPNRAAGASCGANSRDGGPAARAGAPTGCQEAVASTPAGSGEIGAGRSQPGSDPGTVCNLDGRAFSAVAGRAAARRRTDRNRGTTHVRGRRQQHPRRCRFAQQVNESRRRTRPGP
jgi:chemotaxis protein histidine kinase CheA